METFIYYLLKSSLLLTGFYLVYHFLLQKETFYRANRWFLWLGYLASLVLPLITFVKTVVVEAPTFSLTENMQVSHIPAENIAIDWIDIAVVVYGVGLIYFGLKFAINLMQLVKTIRKYRFQKVNKLLVADDAAIESPFSFFRFLFLNTADLAEKEAAFIFKHEQAHANGYHSVDLLFANLHTVFFWFHPFAWWYQSKVNQNLEYLADEAAVLTETDKTAYQQTLLKSLSLQANLPLVHPFYQSFLKNRIVMMNQRKSPKHNAFKYSLMLPLLTLFFLQFQVEVVAQNKPKTIKEKTSEVPLPPPPPTLNVETPTPPPPPTPFVEKPLVIIDGVEQTLEGIKTEDIKNINVLKGEHATEKYGDKGKNGVIEISRIQPDDAYLPPKNLKDDIQSDSLPENALYVIDGKLITRDAVEKLKPENIKEVNVLKGKNATDKYGSLGKNGVIEIHTKIF
jgi:beta-lactamase regulating signal transducer with metallopeptidase domain